MFTNNKKFLSITVAASLLLVVVTAAAVVTAAPLSFASIGDWGCVPIGGWHEQDQLIVAKAFAKTAAEINAEFVLNTGDNFYYCGIEAKDDKWWNTTFENVFSEPSMMVPWFNTLGNHDYGYPTSVQAQIDYRSPNKNRWNLPDRTYYRRLILAGGAVNISLVVLDASPCQEAYRSSNPSGWDPCGSVIPGCPGCTFHQNVVNQSCQKQRQWLQSIIPTIPKGDWKIVMNHAPANDINVDDIISDIQGAEFDMYINGHVHLMAHYQIDGKGTYITTGGGCMVRVPGAEDGSDANPSPLLEKLRRSPKAGRLGATSCPRNPWHSCNLVYQKTVAGYSSHTFSEDYQTLYTYLYNWEGKLLHKLSTKKGTGGGPGSSSAGSSSSGESSSSSNSGSGSGGCCDYGTHKWCPVGMECCSSTGHPYDKYDCERYGWHKGCVWDNNKCIVKGAAASDNVKH